MANRFSVPAGDSAIAKLLAQAVSSVGLAPDAAQMRQLETHFSLLLRWNEKINLTSIRKPEEIALRHFGESLFLAKVLPPPNGLLMDVGSGAGFPGLPLKIVWPAVPVVLLEPNNKKATFLKEVMRSCGLDGVEVRAERLEQAARGGLAGRAALLTMRAVKPSNDLLRDLVRLLAPGGRTALYLGREDASMLAGASGSSPVERVRWQAPIPIPLSGQRVILIGEMT